MNSRELHSPEKKTSLYRGKAVPFMVGSTLAGEVVQFVRMMSTALGAVGISTNIQASSSMWK